MNKLAYFLFVILLIIVVLSCNTKNCKNVAGIEVSDLLDYHTSNREIEYCAMLKQALTGEPSKLELFILLDIYDGAGYDHGIVISEIVEFFGEAKFIELTEGLTQKQKKKVLSYMEVGVEYDKMRQQDMKTEFPILTESWK